MSRGMDSAHQLSDIMAAFNIPDAGDLAQQLTPPVSSSATENSVLAPSTVQNPDSSLLDDSPVQGTGLQGATLLDHIASMTSSSSFASLEQPSRRASAGVKQVLPQGKQPLVPMHLQSGPYGAPSSSTPLGSNRLPASYSEQGLHFNIPSTSTDYEARTTSEEFRHQHEAAMEFDKLYDCSQPVLLYSKEDWPSPNPDLQASDDPDDTNIAPTPQESTEMEPCGYGGISSDTTAGSVVGRRRSQRTQSQGHQFKPSTQYRSSNNIDSTMYSDSLRPFRSVMTAEHKALIAEGLSDSQMIEMLAELQELLRIKQRDATRLRRACLSEEKMEEERRKNRERKRRSRQDPFKEFHQIMTEEQRELLLQPNLDSAVRDNIMTELIATKKTINRDETRKRRARMSAEEKNEERRKSREYKRRAQSDPMQAFKSVITEKHLELLNQDLNEEQRESLVHELIELKKAKQRDDMRRRRARFSSEQKERERAYSRKYMRMRRQRNGGIRVASPRPRRDRNSDVRERIQSLSQPGDVVDVKANIIQDVNRQSISKPKRGRPETIVKEEYLHQDSVDLLHASEEFTTDYASLSKLEQERVRNKIRQRRRRAMQTEQEREEEKRKNRERTRRRRSKIAEVGKVVSEGRLHRQDNFSEQTIDTSSHEGMDGIDDNGWIKGEAERLVRTTPETSCTSSQSSQTQSATTPPKAAIPDRSKPWFTRQLTDEMKKRNRDRTRRARANMTEEQREQERLRNRERQRMRRLLQTPEEREAYIKRQRNVRRQQRRDPAYREKERQRQRLRKKALRESPEYRAHENDMYHIRRARIRVSPIMTRGKSGFQEIERKDGYGDAIQHHQGGSIHSEDSICSYEYDEMEKELANKDIKYKKEVLHKESSDHDYDVDYGNEEESNSDFEEMYERSDHNGVQQNTMQELDKGSENEDEDLKTKTLSSVFGLHKIAPLNT